MCNQKRKENEKTLCKPHGSNSTDYGGKKERKKERKQRHKQVLKGKKQD
jgi:hypothetical protein